MSSMHGTKTATSAISGGKTGGTATGVGATGVGTSTGTPPRHKTTSATHVGAFTTAEDLEVLQEQSMMNDVYGDDASLRQPIKICICSTNVGNAEPTMESLQAWIPRNGLISHVLQTDYDVRRDPSDKIANILTGETNNGSNTTTTTTTTLDEDGATKISNSNDQTKAGGSNTGTPIDNNSNSSNNNQTTHIDKKYFTLIVIGMQEASFECESDDDDDSSTSSSSSASSTSSSSSSSSSSSFSSSSSSSSYKSKSDQDPRIAMSVSEDEQNINSSHHHGSSGAEEDEQQTQQQRAPLDESTGKEATFTGIHYTDSMDVHPNEGTLRKVSRKIKKKAKKKHKKHKNRAKKVWNKVEDASKDVIAKPISKGVDHVSRHVRNVAGTQNPHVKGPKVLRALNTVGEDNDIIAAERYGGDTKRLYRMIRHLLPNYKFVINFLRGQMRLMILVHDSNKHEITHVECKAENTGLGQVLANKGGIVSHLTIRGTRLCFMSAHLAAHEGNEYYKARNNSLVQIWGGAKVGPRPRYFDATMYNHHTFVCGDLNYRITLPPPSEEVPSAAATTSTEREKGFTSSRATSFASSSGAEDDIDPNVEQPQEKVDDKEDKKKRDHERHVQRVLDLIEQRDWTALNDGDELSSGIQQGDCFAGGFVTPFCDFPPTFKMLRQSGYHYTRQRTPSYTDRILWKSLDGMSSHITQMAYHPCVNYITSDHKPIRGAFEIIPCRMIYPNDLKQKEKKKKETWKMKTKNTENNHNLQQQGSPSKKKKQKNTKQPKQLLPEEEGQEVSLKEDAATSSGIGHSLIDSTTITTTTEEEMGKCSSTQQQQEEEQQRSLSCDQPTTKKSFHIFITHLRCRDLVMSKSGDPYISFMTNPYDLLVKKEKSSTTNKLIEKPLLTSLDYMTSSSSATKELNDMALKALYKKTFPKTKTLKSSTLPNPEWTDTDVKLELTGLYDTPDKLRGTFLYLCVFDDDPGNDDLCGTIEINLMDLATCGSSNNATSKEPSCSRRSFTEPNNNDTVVSSPEKGEITSYTTTNAGSSSTSETTSSATENTTSSTNIQQQQDVVVDDFFKVLEIKDRPLVKHGKIRGYISCEVSGWWFDQQVDLNDISKEKLVEKKKEARSKRKSSKQLLSSVGRGIAKSTIKHKHKKGAASLTGGPLLLPPPAPSSNNNNNGEASNTEQEDSEGNSTLLQGETTSNPPNSHHHQSVKKKIKSGSAKLFDASPKRHSLKEKKATTNNNKEFSSKNKKHVVEKQGETIIKNNAGVVLIPQQQQVAPSQLDHKTNNDDTNVDEISENAGTSDNETTTELDSKKSNTTESLPPVPTDVGSHDVEGSSTSDNHSAQRKIVRPSTATTKKLDTTNADKVTDSAKHDGKQQTKTNGKPKDCVAPGGGHDDDDKKAAKITTTTTEEEGAPASNIKNSKHKKKKGKCTLM